MKSLRQIICVSKTALLSVALTLSVVFAFVVFVAGCGGSSSSVSPEQQQTPPPVTSTIAGGVWNGSLLHDLTGQSSALSGVVTEDHVEGRLVTDDGRMFVLQGINVTDGSISATVSAFARPEAVFLDGSLKTSGILTGSFVERIRIDADWSLDTGETGTITLEYDDLYERGSDNARLVGTWEASYGTVYNVDVLGEIFAQSGHGCVYEGQIQLIDAACNVYRVHIMDHCLAAEASGLGILTDGTGTNDAFVLMINLWNGWFITDTLLRQ